MHKRVQRILDRIASAHGFVPYTTITSWAFCGDFSPVAGLSDPNKPDKVIFWFHHEEVQHISVAFQWLREKPDLIESIGGVGKIEVNLSYISSHKKLKKFFGDTKDRWWPPEPPKKKTFFAKLLGRD